MKLLIIGGTGKTGQQLIRQGLERGHTITALVRNPKKVKQEHPNLHVVQGNVLERESLNKVVLGQDAVLSALGHKRFILPSTVLTEGTRNLIAAMKQEGVKRFLCITSLGINESRYRLGLYYTLFTIPVILYFYFRDKARQERLIRVSDLDWTIIRPGQLTNGRQKNTYRHDENAGSYILTKLISRADVAHFMLEQLKKPSYVRKAVGVVG